MKISDSVIKKINDPKEQKAKAFRTKLALALDFTERWILKCAHENKENGPLTLAKAIQVIREETGLSDAEILSEESATIADVETVK